MRCPDCHTEYRAEDLYCRQCGTDLTTSTSTSIVATRSNLPTILYNPQVPRGVAAGVGALALGVGIELLRRNLFARLNPGRTIKKIMKVPRGYEIHETIVYAKRVIRPED